MNQEVHDGFLADSPPSSSSSPVAVCVTGVPTRLLPNSLLINLVQANPDHEFHLIYGLGVLKELQYSTRAHINFDPSPLARLGSSGAIRLGLEAINGPNHKVHVLDLIADYTLEQIQEMLPGPLDRIRQYAGPIITARILNMYQHQMVCADAIERLEQLRAKLFDYVISTREDVYLFHPIDLNGILENHPSCDILTKNCLAWGGLNMRFQVLRRQHGLRFLQSRFEYYHFMQTEDLSVHNPEEMELNQARWLGLSLEECALPIEQLPVTAARHTTDGDFCFIDLELSDDCVPQAQRAFAQAHMCA